jgi:hypothetical protein
MAPAQARGETANRRFGLNENGAGGAGLDRSASETGTIDRMISIVITAKISKPPMPKTGSMYCDSVTAPRSTKR